MITKFSNSTCFFSKYWSECCYFKKVDICSSINHKLMLTFCASTYVLPSLSVYCVAPSRSHLNLSLSSFSAHRWDCEHLMSAVILQVCFHINRGKAFEECCMYFYLRIVLFLLDYKIFHCFWRNYNPKESKHFLDCWMSLNRWEVHLLADHLLSVQYEVLCWQGSFPLGAKCRDPGKLRCSDRKPGTDSRKLGLLGLHTQDRGEVAPSMSSVPTKTGDLWTPRKL